MIDKGAQLQEAFIGQKMREEAEKVADRFQQINGRNAKVDPPYQSRRALKVINYIKERNMVPLDKVVFNTMVAPRFVLDLCKEDDTIRAERIDGKWFFSPNCN